MHDTCKPRVKETQLKSYKINSLIKDSHQFSTVWKHSTSRNGRDDKNRANLGEAAPYPLNLTILSSTLSISESNKPSNQASFE